MNTVTRVGCVVVAAGSGTRLDAGIPKAFVTVGGRTLLEHALDGVAAADCVHEVVVVVPAGDPSPSGLDRALDGRPWPVRVVPGGRSRQESVRLGLAALGACDVVLVHDAARCLAPPALVAAVARAVGPQRPAVVPVVPVADTVRDVDGHVVDRERLRAVQTPQGFLRDVLVRAHESFPDAPADGDVTAGPAAATDDAGLVERSGVAVHLVPGDPVAFKVTTPLDLLLAGAVLAGAQAPGHHPAPGRAGV